MIKFVICRNTVYKLEIHYKRRTVFIHPLTKFGLMHLYFFVRVRIHTMGNPISKHSLYEQI